MISAKEALVGGFPIIRLAATIRHTTAASEGNIRTLVRIMLKRRKREVVMSMRHDERRHLRGAVGKDGLRRSLRWIGRISPVRYGILYPRPAKSSVRRSGSCSSSTNAPGALNEHMQRVGSVAAGSIREVLQAPGKGARSGIYYFVLKLHSNGTEYQYLLLLPSWTSGDGWEVSAVGLGLGHSLLAWLHRRRIGASVLLRNIRTT